MFQPIRGQGGHLVFWIDLINTNLVEDVKILLPVRGEIKNVSAKQRPGLPSCFSDWSEKHNLVEDVEILLPVQQFQRRSQKCRSKSEARAAIFPIGRKNTNLVEDVEILLPVLSSFFEFRSEEKSKMSQPIRGQGGNLVFSISSKIEFFSAVSEEKLKVDDGQRIIIVHSLWLKGTKKREV